MIEPNFTILYVDAAPASAAFYADLFGVQPVESSPGFAMFALPSGVRLGLWTRHTVQPATSAAAGGAELAFAVADDAAVDAMHADWGRRGLRIAQEPVTMEFGRTFTALDPDGHRLRVYAPAAA